MTYWRGRTYDLIKSPYNGRVVGYLLDGELLQSQPTGTRILGHFSTEDGVVVVLAWRKKAVVVAIAALIVAVLALWSRKTVRYFPVVFAEEPVYYQGVLYCNVVNDAEISITVKFLSDTEESETHSLEPGESLPYILIDFAPTTIRYNDTYDFHLEVSCD